MRRGTPRDSLARFGTDLWRYRAVLPFAADLPAVRLGEGGTPLLPLPRLARALGLGSLRLKEESPNPTQSFKARGLALAVNGALAFGRSAVALPSAGNAGSAAAAYAAAAGLRCRIAGVGRQSGSGSFSTTAVRPLRVRSSDSTWRLFTFPMALPRASEKDPEISSLSGLRGLSER